jgi:hypothetical protein
MKILERLLRQQILEKIPMVIAMMIWRSVFRKKVSTDIHKLARFMFFMALLPVSLPREVSFGTKILREF